MSHSLIHNLRRQLTPVRYIFPLSLHILNQLFSFGSARLIKAGIYFIFVGIDQLTHEHPQQQGLPVSLGDAKPSEQLGRYFTNLLIGFQNIGRFTPGAIVLSS